MSILDWRISQTCKMQQDILPQNTAKNLEEEGCCLEERLPAVARAQEELAELHPLRLQPEHVVVEGVKEGSKLDTHGVPA